MDTTRSEDQIKRDVLEELSWDTRVRTTDIGVEVKDGAVRLLGIVDSWARRSAAAEAVSRVIGVHAVINELEVRLSGQERGDDAIADDIRQALVWDVFVPEERIQFTVRHGLVTLEGTVEHHYERDATERAIRNLWDVTAVMNKIVVQVDPSIADIRQAIQKALRRYATREANRIQVEVDNGNVTLSGSVDSWPDRVAAVAAARVIRGVRSVQDNLHVGA